MEPNKQQLHELRQSPYIKEVAAEAEQRGYERAIADAVAAVGEEENAPSANVRLYYSELRAKLEGLRDGTISKKDSTNG